MKKESLEDYVRFAMTRIKLLPGETLNLYWRRTYTPFENNWISDYGVEILGFTFWIHFPNWLSHDEAKP